MPKNTRVHRCVDALKKAKEESGSAFAICQASTNQSYATGKKLKEAIAAKVTKPGASKATKKLGDENDDKWEAEETKKGYWTPAADDITGYNSKTSDNADDDFKHGRWTDETRSKKYGKKIMKKNKQTNENVANTLAEKSISKMVRGGEYGEDGDKPQTRQAAYKDDQLVDQKLGSESEIGLTNSLLLRLRRRRKLKGFITK